MGHVIISVIHRLYTNYNFTNVQIAGKKSFVDCAMIYEEFIIGLEYTP